MTSARAEGMPTVAELLDGFRSGATTPREAVEQCLRAIEATDAALGAVETLVADRALAAADEAGRRWRDGTARALEGIPYGLKDTIDTAGIRTTYGSSLYRDHVPERDAAVQERLVAAGAVLVAKLATYEFESGRNARTGNPWDVDRSSGGSSSGPAASVAAGQLPLAIGSDAGGSIRVPAAWCGAVGLKPTFGRVSRRGAVGCSWTLGHVGPITRTPEDALLALRAIAGPDAEDPYCAVPPPGDVLDAPRPGPGLRIGLMPQLTAIGCDPGIAARVEAAVDRLRAVGAEVRTVRMPLLDVLEPDGLKHVIVPAEVASLHEPHLDRLDELGPAFRTLVLEGQLVPAAEYLRALRVRVLLQRELDAVFREVDAVIAPGSVITAPPREADSVTLSGVRRSLYETVAVTTSLFNLTGTPAVCVPVGLVDGLPASLQVATPAWREPLALRIAAAALPD